MQVLHGKFKQQVAATFFAQLVGLVLSVINAAIIARWFGPEGKGMLALALLVPGMLGLFLSGGISVANVYFAGSRRLDVPTLTANSVGFALLATILGTGIAGGLIATGWLEAVVPGVPAWLVLIAMLGLPAVLLSGYSGYFSTILQGLQRIVAVNKVNLAKVVLTLALTLLFVVGFRLGLLGALLASLGAGVTSLALMGTLLRREGAVFTPRWDLSVMRSTLSFGLRGHIGNMLQFLNYRLDMFIVNYFLGPSGVGIYLVSVRLAELLWHLPSAVQFAIVPRAASSPSEQMNSFTPKVFRIVLLLTLIGAIGLVITGRFIITAVFGTQFSASYYPLLLLLPGVVTLGGAKVLASELTGRGYPQYNSLSAGITAIITIMLDIWLIPKMGVSGAALATSIAYSFTFILILLWHSRKSGIPILAYAKK